MTLRARDMRGNVSIFVAAVVVLAMLLATAVARLGGSVVEKSRANTAADAAALAAADRLALGRSPVDACAAARATAADNGAHLLTCRLDSSAGGALAAEVVLEIHDAQAQARAVVDAPSTRDRGTRRTVAHRAKGWELGVTMFEDSRLTKSARRQ